MSKKFEEWMKTYDGGTFYATTYYKHMREAWNACKEETLKILSQPRYEAAMSIDYVPEKAVEEIKKL